jgi:tight adherence protein B
MNLSMTTFLVGRAAWLLFVLLIAVVVGVEVASERAPLRSRWLRYHAFWHQELTKLHAPWSARKVLSVHVLAALVCLGMLLLGQWVYGLVCLVLVFAPNIWLWRARFKRTERLEEQLDAWLTALTNSLQANPSLGDAIASTIPLMDPPMRDEVELVIKENALGLPLDDALERAAVRSGSRVFRAAITTLKIARNTGGNLPQTLKTASETLREMARLEGVVRTKTADGRAQAVAISILPAPVYFGIEYMMPGYYDPMRNSLTGHIIFAAVGLLWAGAALLSHKILAVDI